ncbi:DinB family protein [Psychrobacillus sp.]|uniref:DinB family protein n=1 Tax=Psychrobacillus sp. TaxID=1871623 RepID=UPI0028BF0B9F|nr:DinB family protein [Psychrobacillus sp.]
MRENTLTQLSSKKDNWLYQENKWEKGTPYNNYYLLFHVMEDEINHRGQLKRLSDYC